MKVGDAAVFERFRPSAPAQTFRQAKRAALSTAPPRPAVPTPPRAAALTFTTETERFRGPLRGAPDRPVLSEKDVVKGR